MSQAVVCWASCPSLCLSFSALLQTMRNSALLLAAAAVAAFISSFSLEKGVLPAAAAEPPEDAGSDSDENNASGLSFEDFLSLGASELEGGDSEDEGPASGTNSRRSSSSSAGGHVEDGLQQLQTAAKSLLGGEVQLADLLTSARERLAAAFAAAADTGGVAGDSFSSATELTRQQLQQAAAAVKEKVNELLQAAAQNSAVQDLQRALELLRGDEPRSRSEAMLRDGLEHFALGLVLGAAAVAAEGGNKGQQLLRFAASAMAQLQKSSSALSKTRRIRRRRSLLRSRRRSREDLLQKLLAEIKKDEEEEEDEEEREALQQVQQQLRDKPKQLQDALETLINMISTQQRLGEGQAYVEPDSE